MQTVRDKFQPYTRNNVKGFDDCVRNENFTVA